MNTSPEPWRGECRMSLGDKPRRHSLSHEAHANRNGTLAEVYSGPRLRQPRAAAGSAFGRISEDDSEFGSPAPLPATTASPTVPDPRARRMSLQQHDLDTARSDNPRYPSAVCCTTPLPVESSEGSMPLCQLPRQSFCEQAWVPVQMLPAVLQACTAAHSSSPSSNRHASETFDTRLCVGRLSLQSRHSQSKERLVASNQGIPMDFWGGMREQMMRRSIDGRARTDASRRPSFAAQRSGMHGSPPPQPVNVRASFDVGDLEDVLNPLDEQLLPQLPEQTPRSVAAPPASRTSLRAANHTSRSTLFRKQ